MEKRNIDMYLAANSKYFETASIPVIRQKLEKLSDDDYMTLQAVELKDPTVIVIISILVGCLGIDRFMIGDVSMGILKLCTGGLCGILTIIDWFTISKKVKQLNFANINMVL